MGASELRSAIDGADLLFIMGGGTGTHAAPVIARIARGMGILTVAAVTMPFSWEGGRRSSAANVGLAKLRVCVDTLIVLPNDKLIETLGDGITQNEAFQYVNDVVKNAVSGIADIINVPSAVNVDFRDVRSVMCEPGTAFIGSATASGSERARLAAEQALTSPMQESKNVFQAKGALVIIASAQRVLKLSEARLPARINTDNCICGGCPLWAENRTRVAVGNSNSGSRCRLFNSHGASHNLPPRIVGLLCPRARRLRKMESSVERPLPGSWDRLMPKLDQHRQ